MTSTEPVLIPTKEIRTRWIEDLINAASSIPEGAPSQLWDGLLLLMLKDGPALCSELNRWWPRRFARIRLRMQRGEDARDIVIEALRDMKISNDFDGR